jgi:UDP-glucuronate 4-epimerase
MYGGGTTKKDYTFVDDILQGVLASMQKLHGFEVMNLEESNTILLKSIISFLEEKMGKKAIIQRLPEQPGDVILTNVDISKARSILAYNPSVSVKNRLSVFVKWFLQRETL